MKARHHDNEDKDPPNLRALPYDALNIGLGDIGKISGCSRHIHIFPPCSGCSLYLEELKHLKGTGEKRANYILKLREEFIDLFKNECVGSKVNSVSSVLKEECAGSNVNSVSSTLKANSPINSPAKSSITQKVFQNTMSVTNTRQP